MGRGMDGKFGVWLTVMMCGALLWGSLLCPAAGAEVLSTPEAAGGPDCVYVAGNPDWYPVEYYDRDAKCYAGVLPELLELVSEKTGLNFTYVSAGEEDQRLRLAKNGQVEMVSGYAWDAEELRDYSMTESRIVLTIPQEQQAIQVCFAFTDIAGDGLIAAVEGALDEISGDELAGIAVSTVMESGGERTLRWLLPVGLGALILLAAVIAVLAVQRRRYKKAAEQDERYDLVTGFGNKKFFTERFEKFIPDQYRGIYCVVFIGFDIARVNQYYGEAAAEDQLVFAENELMKSTADNEFAARVSGGGFAVARPSSGEAEASMWTRELLSRLNQYAETYGKDYHPNFRAGIYMLQPSDRDCETVLFNARQGYQLAVNSDADFAFSRGEMLSQENEKRMLKKQTLEAIRNGEFKMFLQFIICSEDGKISGAEALSRWEHPQKGLLYPGNYIDLMESEDTIQELDFYIFEESCRQLEAWEKEGKRVSISCNFTRGTIEQENFISRLWETAERYFFDRTYLIIEITEDVAEKSRKTVFENITKCKKLGFRIALDDIGSGYTSFSDLRDYPIDIVKIDKSILNAAVDANGVALLDGMVALVHSLHVKALCEGVETEQQAELLRRLGCDYMQGYHFFRPLPKKEAERVLQRTGGRDFM